MTTFVLSDSASDLRLEQIFNQEIFDAESGAVQVRGRNGNRWSFELNFQNLYGDKRRRIWGLIAGLNGAEHRLQVNLADHAYTRGGVGGGTPTLNGSASTGARQILIQGAPSSRSNWLLPGDFLTIGNELKIVTGDPVDTNASGVATISVWPELHHDFPALQAVEIDAPHGVFIMRDNGGFAAGSRMVEWLDPGLGAQFVEDILA